MRTILSGAILLLFPSGLCHSENVPKHTYQTVPMGEGIVAFIASESNTGVVSGNSVAIVGDDGVLVVDSTNFPSHARQIIAEIRQKTNQPVHHMVHTHWHPFAGARLTPPYAPDHYGPPTHSSRTIKDVSPYNPFAFMRFRTLWRNEESATPLRSIVSAFFPVQRRVGVQGNFPISSLTYILPVPYALSPLFLTLTKTAGVWGYSSHSGTARTSVHSASLRCRLLLQLSAEDGFAN